ncbi:hypothetical protein HNV11_21395 [Spirosoma taeanense]|uniref:Uncharacterized protein n=1 Tax=Spirosoma taeanense TaxID=2735870 RepID=A0A6M5XZ28_9BACT|nr:hypothetical protein [Spirosoma taeanense]QJW87867.1 hypothetical protein HNV11_21395 [Spirosoma taeanense]
MKKPRKDRSDITIGSFEKKHNLKEGTIRNPDGSDSRSDKELGNLEKEFGEKAVNNMIELSPEHAELLNDILGVSLSEGGIIDNEGRYNSEQIRQEGSGEAN